MNIARRPHCRLWGPLPFFWAQNSCLLRSPFSLGLQVRAEGGALWLCVDTGLLMVVPIFVFWQGEHIPASHCKQGGWW